MCWDSFSRYFYWFTALLGKLRIITHYSPITFDYKIVLHWSLTKPNRFSFRQLKAKKENGENKGRFGLHLGVNDYQMDMDEYS